MRISESELAQRRDRLREHAPDGFVLFTPDAIRYFTDFWFLSNERPIAYAELGQLESRINNALKNGTKLDAYSKAHLEESAARIHKVIDARLQLRSP